MAIIYSSPRIVVTRRGGQLSWVTGTVPSHTGSGNVSQFTRWARMFGISEECIAHVAAELGHWAEERRVAEPLGQPGERIRVLLTDDWGLRQRRRGVDATVIVDTERFRLSRSDNSNLILELRSPRLGAARVLRRGEYIPAFVLENDLAQLAISETLGSMGS